MLEHYDEYDETHCENYCNKFNCIFKSPIQHSLGDCVRCTKQHSCNTFPHCVTDLAYCVGAYANHATRPAAKSGPPGRGGGWWWARRRAWAW
jgi:hypothetical protein